MPDMNMPERETLIKPLEEMQFGSWQLSISGSADIWSNQDNVKKLNTRLKSIYDEIQAKLPGVCVLKAVIISNNFREDVFKYQRALGYSTELSDCSDGYVAGKTLRWGNGDIEKTYAIIIHPEEVAVGIVKDLSLCSAAFAHELGHVFEGLLLRNFYRIDDRIIYAHQWNELRESIAQSVFGEFFAQIIAFPYMDKEEHQGHVMLAVDVLRSTLKNMEHEISKYRISHELNYLWSYTLEKNGFLYSQFGRSLGIVQQLSKGDESDAKIIAGFYKALEAINPKWSELVEQLLVALDIKEELDPKKLFSEIGVAIENGFDLIGVIPITAKETNNSIYVDVPFR